MHPPPYEDITEMDRISWGTLYEDDVILVPGEIDFLRATFGQRAFIYPRGGHLGNLALAQTQADYVGFLLQ